MLDPYSPDILWIIIVGFIISFILAFGIGANDVANSFGTSVGSGVLTIRAACWLATFCEVTGAVLIGYKVSDTMRKGILDVDLYRDAESELMLGFVSALASSAVWLLVATYMKLPISGTHSIVGSTLGFSLVARGTQGVQWLTLGKIIGSWFISPVLSGLISTILFWCIRTLVLNSSSPLKAGFLALPLIYGLTTAINVLSIVFDGPKMLYMDNISAGCAALISLTIGFLVIIAVQLFVVPWQRRKITGNNRTNDPVKFTINDSSESTPSGSPKKNRRPASFVQTDLPAITEQTELASFNNLGDLSPCLLRMGNKTNDKQTNLLANGNYKIDPKIIEKVETLLDKNRSLDNIDLTVTSLNFIDEHHQQNGLNAMNNCETIQTYFNDISIPLERVDPNNDVIIPISNTIVLSGKIISADNKKQSNNNNDPNGNNTKIDVDQIEVTTLSPNSSKVPLITSKTDTTIKTDEPEDVSQLFSFLQILTATFGSFAHGGNDVCNAIGPLIALWMIYKEGTVLQQSETPLSLLFFGGVGISIGLWVLGRRVIETVGNDLTKITPSTGFTIEIGSALTVLLASKIGLPISTTHCKVGSVIFVGYANAARYTKDDKLAGIARSKPVDWALFRSIVYAWIVTVPISALLSAFIMFILSKSVL